MPPVVPLDEWVRISRDDPSYLQEALDSMTLGERASLRSAAEFLVRVLDPDNWCSSCNGYINPDEEAGLAKFYSPTSRVHHRCWMKAHNNHKLVETAFDASL